jgi:hypothetical protein
MNDDFATNDLVALWHLGSAPLVALGQHWAAAEKPRVALLTPMQFILKLNLVYMVKCTGALFTSPIQSIGMHHRMAEDSLSNVTHQIPLLTDDV